MIDEKCVFKIGGKKTHSSVKSQFSFHYIKTKRLDKKHGQLLNILFDLRQKGDYGNMYTFDK